MRILKAAISMVFLLGLTCAQALAEAGGIGWIPTWKQGLSEARRTNKPILLMAAAPQCAGVPGQW